MTLVDSPKNDFVDTLNVNVHVPVIGDETAPKPELGKHHISLNAIRCRTRRIFTRKVDGQAKVSETIFQEWQQGGQGRRTLEEIFKQCGYCADPWF